MFKPGDIIIYINHIVLFTITNDVKYTTINYDDIYVMVKIINDYDEISYYKSNRFILDIKETRNQKLKQICSK